MLFEQIVIHNFRGIHSLSLEKIGRVNVMTGRNNCGKTSVLEAIFLLIGISNPQLTLNIHRFRDLLLSDDEDFSFLFKDFDIHTPPHISGKLDSQERTLDITALHPTISDVSLFASEERELSQQEEFQSNVSMANQDLIDGLRFKFRVDNGQEFSNEIRLKHRKVELSPEYQEKLNATFLNPTTVMADLDRRLDAILVRKDLGTIIEALREIEPQLSDIRMGAQGMVYADIGIEKLVPVNIMGDGIRRILAILAAITERKNGIVLIDEIENGFHYRTLSTLWKAIFKIATSNNVQLFVTTHSYECIQVMTEVYQCHYSEADLLALFRIEKAPEGAHRALHYTADALLAGLEQEFEVR